MVTFIKSLRGKQLAQTMKLGSLVRKTLTLAKRVSVERSYVRIWSLRPANFSCLLNF